MTVLAIAGGVGGSKLALGLSKLLSPDRLIIAVNTGDDFTHLGLRICPDLDTVMYTLAGMENPETGWGVACDTWETMSALEALGGPTWFRLGNRDIATHLERTRRLAAGEPLSKVTAHLARSCGVKHRIVPASDQNISTVVETPLGQLPFQKYFVELGCKPTVQGFQFVGAENARPAPALQTCFDKGEIEAVIICPSNPYVSIAPIIAIPGIRAFLRKPEVSVVSVSPIVGGKALKGPTAKIMRELGIQPSSLAIAEHYSDIVSKFFIDVADENQVEQIAALGVETTVSRTVMTTIADKTRLARDVLVQAGINIDQID